MQAKETQNATIITVPYIDYFTDELVISLVRSVHDVETGNFTGAIGIDYLVNSLKEYVLPEYKLARELVFFSTTGRVLLDSDWYTNSSGALDFNSSYNTIENPSLSDSAWDEIVTTEPGQNKNINTFDSYYCNAFRFDAPLEEFVFVACALEETMLEVTMKHSINRLQLMSIVINVIIIDVCVCVYIYIYIYEY
jgi:hypothetical protein